MNYGIMPRSNIRLAIGAATGVFSLWSGVDGSACGMGNVQLGHRSATGGRIRANNRAVAFHPLSLHSPTRSGGS